MKHVVKGRVEWDKERREKGDEIESRQLASPFHPDMRDAELVVS